MKEDTLNYIAGLSKLEFADKEAEIMNNELDCIIATFDGIKNFDANVENTSNTIVENIFREDKVVPSLNKDELLNNAPDTMNGYFKVPKTFE